MLWTNCIFSIMSRYKTFYRNQYTNIFLGHFLYIEENNSWTIRCHRYEIFQVNALIGVIPFSDWPCWGSRTVCIKYYSSHLLGNWWKGDLLLKWRNCVTLHSLEICGFHLLLFVDEIAFTSVPGKRLYHFRHFCYKVISKVIYYLPF